jgi:hypothetical protein
MFCSVYSVFIVPTGTLRLPWLRFFRAFSSVVRQMPGYNSQRRGTAPTLYTVSLSLILVWLFWARIPESLPTKFVNCVVLCIVCKCVLYYCHRVWTQLQLTNIYHITYHTYHIVSHIIYIISSYHIYIISYHIISYHICIISFHISYHISFHISYHISFHVSYHI